MYENKKYLELIVEFCLIIDLFGGENEGFCRGV